MADKSLAEAVNDDMAGPSSDAMGPGQDDYDASMQSCMDDFATAHKAGDSAGMDSALRNWHDLAHKASGDALPDSDEGSGKGVALLIGGPHGGS